MRSGTYHRIMIYDRPTVHQHRTSDPGIGIYHRSLHHKAARLQHRTRTYNCRRMHDCRYLIPFFQQFIRPVQTHLVISKCCYCHRILLMSDLIITAHSDDRFILHRIIQKYNLFIPQCLRSLRYHPAESACTENQQTFHYVFPPIVFLLISYTISYHRSGPGDSYFHKKLRRITGSRILRSFFVFIFILERGSLLGTYFKDSSIFQGYSIPYGVRHPFRQ